MKKLLLGSAIIAGALVSISLTSCGSKEIVVYTAAEEERIAYLDEKIKEKFPETSVVFQPLGTGTMLNKLQTEGTHTPCDIFYDLEITNAEIILDKNKDLFYDLSEFDFSIYEDSVQTYMSKKKYALNSKVYNGFLVNKTVLTEKGASIPTCYDDLLKPEYRGTAANSGIIVMPNPKQSGTGYCLYNGIYTKLGEDAALAYFENLNKNIKEFTNSGSAPVKSVDRGDAGIAAGMLWQCCTYANKNNNLQVVTFEEGMPFNLFTMGIINSHETKAGVKEVFEYLFKELNMSQNEYFNPDKIYKNQGAAKIEGYPTTINELTCNGVSDFQYKQNLLNKWSY
jgi:iron(III) transport system substrate-binding protein